MALPHDQIEPLPHDRNEIETGAIGNRSHGDSAIRASGPNCLRDIGPGRARRADANEPIDPDLRAVQKGMQEQLRAGAVGTNCDSRAAFHDVANVGDAERIAGRDHKALLTTGESNQHGVVTTRLVADRLDIGVDVLVIRRMQMDGGSDEFTPDEAAQSCFTAFRQGGET